jgi:succinyl-diaminopimelate desuccinylase
MENKIYKNLIKLTSELIRFKTTKENYAERLAIIEYIEKQFANKKVYIKKYNKAQSPAIVIVLGEEKNPKIILSGHLDVVSADKKEYVPKVKDGKLFGRGSGDMKAGCAVMIEIMKYFSKQEKKPSLGLMLTTDEEIGGANGVKYLVEEKKYRPQLVIIPDGGIDLKTIITHQKGILHLKIKTYGKAAHGSRPFMGENAIEKLMHVYQEIKKIIPELAERKWENTMNLGKISGGGTVNKVPDYAEMHLDIRYTQKNNEKTILKKVQKIAFDVEILAKGDPFIQDNNHHHVAKYKRVAESELLEEINFYKVEGASDARYFSQYNIPSIITKIKCGNIHGENEWVDIKEMEKFYLILIKFINQF